MPLKALKKAEKTAYCLLLLTTGKTNEMSSMQDRQSGYGR